MKKITGALPAFIFGSLGIFNLQIASAADPKLLGCWGNGKAFFSYSDGKYEQQPFHCVREYRASEYFSFCDFSGAGRKISSQLNRYSYAIQSGGRYDYQWLETNGKVFPNPRQRVSNYVITGTRLRTIVQTDRPARSSDKPVVVRSEQEFVRVSAAECARFGGVPVTSPKPTVKPLASSPQPPKQKDAVTPTAKPPIHRESSSPMDL